MKTSFNLKNLFDKVEEEKPAVENLEGKPKDAFTEEILLKFWNEFVDELMKNNQIPAYNALHSGKVELKEDFKIRFEFTSSSLANEFEIQKDNLMRFLREKLNNYSIDFQVDVIGDSSKNYVKSSQEKFKDMVEINPILLKMREEFGLDYNSNE